MHLNAQKMPMLIDEHIKGLTEMKYTAYRKSIHSMNEKIKKSRVLSQVEIHCCPTQASIEDFHVQNLEYN